MSVQFEAVIGLEIHVELKTATKMFCPDVNDPDEERPNVNVCPICLGHPGTLPVPNANAIAHVLKVALALGAHIPARSKFDRKHYFYPDLPKGYQISQYDEPLCEGGTLALASGKKIRIRRVHLEEDTARLGHDPASGASLVDFNRAGIPLMELVSEPDIANGEEAGEFAEELRTLFRYLDISDANMEKGQMRVEANISLRKKGAKTFGTKVEVKNLNSFRAVREAIAYELKRQGDLLAGNKKVIQETRGWDAARGVTEAQRHKEEASDYRYFPEPDIPAFIIPQTDAEATGLLPSVTALKQGLPELPWVRRERFRQEYGLTPTRAQFFVNEQEIGEFLIATAAIWQGEEPARFNTRLNKAAHALAGQVKQVLNESGRTLAALRITPESLAEYVEVVEDGTVSNVGAQKLLGLLIEKGGSARALVKEQGLAQVSDTGALAEIIKEAIRDNPQPVADFKAGKEAALQFLVGKVMAASKGRANPQVAREELIKHLT